MKRAIIVIAILSLMLWPLNTTSAAPLAVVVNYQVTFGETTAPGYYAYSAFITEGTPSATGGNPGHSARAVFNRVDGFGFNIDAAYVSINLPTDCSLTETAGDYQANGSANYGLYALDASDELIGSIYYDSSSPSTYTHFSHNFGGLDTAVKLIAYIEVTDNPIGSKTAYVDNVSFTCADIAAPPPGISDGPYQPIREDLQKEVITTTTGGAPSGPSLIAGIPDYERIKQLPAPVDVYASIDGTVEVLTKTPTGFKIVIAGFIDGDAFVVTIDNLAEVYLKQGDPVTAGCIIGAAGEVIKTKLEGEDAYNIKQIIFSAQDDGGNYIDWTVWDSPTSTTQCSGLLNNEQCINNNSTFSNHASGWTTTSAPSGAAPTVNVDNVLLPFESNIEQDLALYEGNSYVITVWYSAPTKSKGELQVRLGDAAVIEPWSAAVADQQYTIELGPLTPTEPNYLPDVYTFSIYNISPLRNDIRLHFACLHYSDTALETPPSMCYFPDSEFVSNGSWTLSGGASFIQTGLQYTSGAHTLALPDSAIASYPVTLKGYDDSDADYTLSLDVWPEPWRPWLLASAPYGDIKVDYTGTSATSNTVEVKPQALGATSINVTGITIPMGDTETGTIEVSTDALYNSATELRVTRICLSPDSGYWPGQENSTYLPVPVASTCQDIPDPSPDTSGDWWDTLISTMSSYLNYLFALLLRFWRCDLPKYMNQVYASLNDAAERISWWPAMLGRWLSASFSTMAKWFIQVLKWTRGTLINGVLAALQSIWEWLLTIPFFKALYDEFLAAQDTAERIKDLVLLIASLPGAFLKAVANIAKLSFRLWQAFVTGMADDYTPDIGPLDCEAVPGGINTICEGFHRVDTAIVGSLFLYGFWQACIAMLFVAVLYLTFKRIRKEFTQQNAEGGA